MSNKRFNNVANLNVHKEINYDIDLAETGNEFISKHESRYQNFGKFDAKDFL